MHISNCFQCNFVVIFSKFEFCDYWEAIERSQDQLHNQYNTSYSLIKVRGSHPGAGETILTDTFIASICEQGEKVLYLGFEESEAAMDAATL